MRIRHCVQLIDATHLELEIELLSRCNAFPELFGPSMKSFANVSCIFCLSKITSYLFQILNHKLVDSQTQILGIWQWKQCTCHEVFQCLLRIISYLMTGTVVREQESAPIERIFFSCSRFLNPFFEHSLIHPYAWSCSL